MSELTFRESALTDLIGIFAAFDKGDLVVPPGKVTPVSLKIFFEFAILLGVLAYS
jgi:hypothetical protein